VNIQDKIEIETRSLVLVGEFNPMIFQPMWFSHYGLVGEKEANDAKIKIIHKDVVIFELDWVTIEINRQQFIAITNKPAYYPFVKDLIVGIFTLLSHTPIKKMGINMEVHYNIYNKEIKTELERKLYPYKIFEQQFDNPVFNKVEFTEERKDSYKGFTKIDIEPSNISENGIFFSINDHFEVMDEKKSIGSSEIMKIFTENWEISYENGLQIIEKIKNI